MKPLDPDLVAALRSQLTDLTDELTELAQQHKATAQRIEAVKVLLASQPTAEQPDQEAATFSGKIREALRKFPRGASPTEVAEKMLADGFVWEQERDFAGAVNSNLHRMADRGRQVRRVRRGVYRAID